MKKMLLIKVVLLTFYACHALAQESNQASNQILYEGVDITAFVDYFRPLIRTLKKSATVYSWSNGEGKKYWESEHDPDDPDLFTYSMTKAQSFWNNYGSEKIIGFYGNALYAAVDPVYTYMDYGQKYYSNEMRHMWILHQMQLPIGFKFIIVDAGYDEMKFTDAYKDVIEKFKCNAVVAEKDKLLGVVSMFRMASYTSKIGHKCPDLVKYVFKDIFKIDGFAYQYGGRQFKACSYNYDNINERSNLAFVITDYKWMRPEYIRFYTKKTTKSLEDRIRIQTLFLKEGQNRLSTRDFADSFINRFEAQHTEPNELLWPDLEGQPKDPNIDDWIKNNIFNCNGSSH